MIIKIAKCDGLISIVDGSISYETMQTMVYANVLQKLVLSLITNGHENHSWLKYTSNAVFTNLKELETCLIGIQKFGNSLIKIL